MLSSSVRCCRGFGANRPIGSFCNPGVDRRLAEIPHHNAVPGGKGHDSRTLTLYSRHARPEFRGHSR
jgi:hypothetical protein